MIYAVFGALIIGLSLGLLGSGGSILTVPVLVYILGHEDKVAIAESLAIVGAIALFTALPYARSKLVDWRTAALFGGPGMVGTYLGAWISSFVPGFVQLLVFAGVMLVTARKMWRASRNDRVDEGSGRRALGKIVVDGLAVGVLTGFVGVGGGFLIVPALVLLGGLSMRRAVATSLIIIALKSAAGFWKYLDVLQRLEAQVNWGIIGTFVALGVVGSLMGRSLNSRFDPKTLQRGFALFLLLMAGFILFRESDALLSGISGG